MRWSIADVHSSLLFSSFILHTSYFISSPTSCFIYFPFHNRLFLIFVLAPELHKWYTLVILIGGERLPRRFRRQRSSSAQAVTASRQHNR